jgi:hypothetical protein
MIQTMLHSRCRGRYKYPPSQTMITYLLMPAVSLTCIGLGVFLLIMERAVVSYFLILVGMGFMFLSAFGSLMCSSIIVTDDGIAACNYGRTLKFIRWRDATGAKKVRRWNAGSRGYDDVYHIFDGSGHERIVNLLGPIVFTDKIIGLREILDSVNDAARGHHFPLTVSDQEAARKPVAPNGAAPWRGRAAKVEENSVTEF